MFRLTALKHCRPSPRSSTRRTTVVLLRSVPPPSRLLLLPDTALARPRSEPRLPTVLDTAPAPLRSEPPPPRLLLLPDTVQALLRSEPPPPRLPRPPHTPLLHRSLLPHRSLLRLRLPLLRPPLPLETPTLLAPNRSSLEEPKKMRVPLVTTSVSRRPSTKPIPSAARPRRRPRTVSVPPRSGERNVSRRLPTCKTCPTTPRLVPVRCQLQIVVLVPLGDSCNCRRVHLSLSLSLLLLLLCLLVLVTVVLFGVNDHFVTYQELEPPPISYNVVFLVSPFPCRWFCTILYCAILYNTIPFNPSQSTSSCSRRESRISLFSSTTTLSD